MMDELTFFERMLFAIRRDDAAEIVRILRADRSLVHATDPNFSTPLHFAAAEGSLKALETLLGWGADINAINRIGRTPLCVAAVEGEIPAMTLLLQKGASPNAVTSDGHNTLPFSVGDQDVIKMLLDAGMTLDKNAKDTLSFSEWHYKEGRRSMALFFFDHCKMDVNERDCISQGTILHAAGIRGDAAFAQELLKRGARVDIKNCAGLTPLMLAVWHSETFKALFDKCKNPDHADEGETLLHRAALEGNLDIARFLLEQGAAINVKNNAGLTPLEIAQRLRRDDVAAFLDGEQKKISFDKNIKAIDSLIKRPKRPKF